MKRILILVECECDDTTRPHPRHGESLEEVLRLASERQIELLARIVTLGPIPKVTAQIVEEAR